MAALSTLPELNPDSPGRPIHCSFCGKSEDEVKRLVVSDHQAKVAICNECYVFVAEIMEESEKRGWA